MAIDIVLTKNRLRQKFNIETSIRFDDSGDYQFLQPFFEKLRVTTSEIIDLYDDCEFEGENLIKLKNELEKEIFRLSKQKEEKWSVFIGTQTLPFKKEIYKEVIKKDLIQKLRKWLSITDLAIETEEKIIGIGD